MASMGMLYSYTPSSAGAQMMRSARPVAVSSPAPFLVTTKARKVVVCRQAAVSDTVGILQKSRPIDRMRYQAKLVFDTFDRDGDGKLTLADLQSYISYSEARLGEVPALQEQYSSLSSTVSSRASQELDFEEFVDLVRAQVKTIQQTSNWAMSKLSPKDISRLLHKSALTVPEMGAVLATFKLLDREGNGTLRLEDLKKAQGIEKKVVEGVLEDADEDEDGLLTFEDFLTSYHKKRPVFMSMAVMLAHTACFWVIFQLPIDTMLKVLLAAVLVLKPQLVTSPVVKIWRIGEAVWGRLRATREMAAKGASWSSLA